MSFRVKEKTEPKPQKISIPKLFKRTDKIISILVAKLPGLQKTDPNYLKNIENYAKQNDYDVGSCISLFSSIKPGTDVKTIARVIASHEDNLKKGLPVTMPRENEAPGWCYIVCTDSKFDNDTEQIKLSFSILAGKWSLTQFDVFVDFGSWNLNKFLRECKLINTKRKNASPLELKGMTFFANVVKINNRLTVRELNNTPYLDNRNQSLRREREKHVSIQNRG